MGIAISELVCLRSELANSFGGRLEVPCEVVRLLRVVACSCEGRNEHVCVGMPRLAWRFKHQRGWCVFPFSQGTLEIVNSFGALCGIAQFGLFVLACVGCK